MRLFYLINIFAYRIDYRILKYYIAINNRPTRPKENTRENAMNELRQAFEEYLALNAAYMDENLSEEESDALYERFWASAERVAQIITTLTGGEIDHITAMRMVYHRHNEIRNLLARAA